MKYIKQCLVYFLDHTNIPNVHLSSLDGNSTSEKKSENLCTFFVKI